MHTTLLVMAAGMGSRFGGNKQIAQIGPNGEILLHYSIYDAAAAGFDKVVFVIKRAMESDFRRLLEGGIPKGMEVHYAFQEFDNLPGGFIPPEGRTKPYGTVHAVLAAKDVIAEPFAVINADDYYGQDAFVLTSVLENRPTKTTYLQQVFREGADPSKDRPLVSGQITACIVEKDSFKPISIKRHFPELYELYEGFVQPQSSE